MTYNELISRFEVIENPPYKKGFERHHIVPESEQIKMFGSVTDERQIYVSLPQHMWLHVLYDREHDTHTAQRFLSICGKPIEYFDCFEKVLECNDILRKKREEQFKKQAEVMKTPEYRQNLYDAMNRPEVRKKLSDSHKGKPTWMKGHHHSDETKKKIADAKKGKNKNTWSKGQKWFNDGTKSVMAYECPEGYISGMLCNKRPSLTQNA